MYNYEEAVWDDVNNFINEDFDQYDWSNRYRVQDKLFTDMYDSDNVTGNASGSYTCNAWQASENLNHNFDLLAESLDEYETNKRGIVEVLRSPEKCDVFIRCYLLCGILNNYLDENWEELKQRAKKGEEE